MDEGIEGFVSVSGFGRHTFSTTNFELLGAATRVVKMNVMLWFVLSYVTITHRYTLLFAPLHVPGRGALAVLKTLTARLISYARQLCLSSAGSAPITPLQLSFIHLNQETTPC